MTATWAFVHGFSVLAIEGQLSALIKLAPPGTDAMKLLDIALADLSARRRPVDAAAQSEKPSSRPATSRAPQRRSRRAERP
jgi:hypothetical protein